MTLHALELSGDAAIRRRAEQDKLTAVVQAVIDRVGDEWQTLLLIQPPIRVIV